MKKHFKYLAAAGLIAALFLSAGCVDDAKDKKPAPETEKRVENVVVKPQDGKYYRYPDYINDVTKTPKMTPEIVKYIDDFASTLKFHPDSKGKFTNTSLIKNPEETTHYINMSALGPNHNNKIKFKNSKGKGSLSAGVYSINMTIDAATDKLKSVRCSIFEQNPDIPDGQTTYVVKKRFD